MAAPVNVKQAAQTGVGEKAWIPLNRWGPDNYTVNVIITGVATVNLEGTIIPVNRTTPTSDDIFAITGAQNITTTTQLAISDLPLEAIRQNIASGAGDVELHVFQPGHES